MYCSSPPSYHRLLVSVLQGGLQTRLSGPSSLGGLGGGTAASLCISLAKEITNVPLLIVKATSAGELHA